jgi:nitroreductase
VRCGAFVLVLTRLFAFRFHLLSQAGCPFLSHMNSNVDMRLGFIFGRRSIRAYSGEPVSEGVVQKLLEAAMAAPSAVAKDPWRFVVVHKRVVLEQLAPVLSNGEMLLRAGTGIVVCGDLDVAHDRQLSYLLQDCAASIENTLLCAHILGLGACWLGVHPREQRMKSVIEILRLPKSVVPVGCVCVGHPAEVKEPRTRFNRSYVHLDQW